MSHVTSDLAKRYCEQRGSTDLKTFYGVSGGVMEREWVAAFDLLSFNSFEQLPETTKIMLI